MFFFLENVAFRVNSGMTDYVEWGAHSRRNGAQARVFPSMVPELCQNHQICVRVEPRNLHFILNEGIAYIYSKGHEP